MRREQLLCGIPVAVSGIKSAWITTKKDAIKGTFKDAIDENAEINCDRSVLGVIRKKNNGKRKGVMKVFMEMQLHKHNEETK